MIQILELFGGIGSPRCALRNIGIPVKAIDYVEIDEKAVRSYNAMFADELPYKTQSVVGWNLKPDILIHGSPCQDFSIAGHQGKAKAEDGRINRGKGADKGSGTRSSLMWETIHIIEQMGEWKPQYVIWENVKNVLSKYMRVNFNRYLAEMERLGYSNNFEILDARDFGLPQARERVFTVSVLGKEKFIFDDLIKTPMQDINKLLFCFSCSSSAHRINASMLAIFLLCALIAFLAFSYSQYHCAISLFSFSFCKSLSAFSIASSRFPEYVKCRIFFVSLIL